MSNTAFHSSQVKLQPVSSHFFFQYLHREVGYHSQRWLSRKVREILKKAGKSTNPWCQGSLASAEVSVSEALRDPQASASRCWKPSSRLEATLQQILKIHSKISSKLYIRPDKSMASEWNQTCS